MDQTKEEHKDTRICAKCGGKMTSGETTALCKFCLRKNRITYKNMRQKRIDRHECVYCTAPLPEGYEDVVCDDCKRKNSERAKKYNHENRGKIFKLTIHWHNYPDEIDGLREGTRYWITVETDNGPVAVDAMYLSGEFRSRDGVYDDAAVTAWAPYIVPKPYKGG